MEVVKYIVLFNQNYNNGLAALQQLGGYGQSYRTFIDKISLQDWLSDEVGNLKGIRIFQIGKVLKLKKDKVELVEI